ncbi:hypothetical protein C7M87_04920 [Klebsiella pneumoniae]|nr:hypothetical protein C7M87_04920 [Klebsiella pneumoniae]HBX8452394.1 hypothetical protein [Klebsiella pneumoniae]
MFLLFIFIMLAGEYSVNSEHFTVHSGRCAGKKRPAMPVRVGYVAVGSSHFGSQSALLSSLRARLVCIP